MERTATPVQSTTPDPLKQALVRAETLLQSVEGFQNELANAHRRRESGQTIDEAKVVEAAQKKLATIEQQVSACKSTASRRPEPVDVAAAQLVDDYWSYIAGRKDTASTGLTKLNTMLGGGLESQRLVILLGAPGGGKTTLANQIAVHTSDAGRPVLYVTSEDVPFTLLAKTIARRGQLSYSAVLKGYESEREHITATMVSYRASRSAERLHYLDASSGMDLETVRERARVHFERFREAGQGILVIDYLQRMARAQALYRNGSGDLRQAVTMLTEQLRAIAVELDCCVLALASQNRASGYGASTNSLSSAKESGDIEYTADVIMALGDDDRMPSVTWLKAKVLKLDKNRQGDVGTIALDWYPERQQFTEVGLECEQGMLVPNGRKRAR